MGEVGNFLFGGGTSKQTGVNSSQNQAQSTNSSTNNSVQAAASGSANTNRSGGSNYNQAYGPIAAAMTPTLGYTNSAANMMAALLGVPQSNFKYDQELYTPGTSILPPAAESGDINVTLPDLSSIVDALAGSTPTLPPPAPTPAPNPTAPTLPPPPAVPPPVNPADIPATADAIQQGAYAARKVFDSGIPTLDTRAHGGPVEPGQSYLVGENEPEVFVPSSPGTIIPGPLGRAGYTGRTGRGDWREKVMQHMMYRGGERENRQYTGAPTSSIPPLSATTPAATTATTPAAAAAPAPLNASSALENFTDSAGMNFILDQGQKAISGASAANGVFNSGATGKALVQYGQNLGQTYLDRYMGYLNQLGQLGLGAGSAMSNAGTVSSNQAVGGGRSTSISGGLSSGSSTGISTSTGSSQGTTSGKSNQKNGLLPAVGSLIPG